MRDQSHDKRTQTVQAEIGKDPAYGSVPPPLYLSSTYLWESADEKGTFDYGRSNNPNRSGLARALSALEGGAGAVITSSGMAAIDLVFNLFTPDDLILAPHDCYGGTHRLLTHRRAQGRMNVIFVDQTNSAALAAAMEKKPKLILIETPSNPLMRLVDIAKLSKAAKACGALVMVDNTFLSPARQTPLALGADIVVHSTTKHLNGHSDIIGGAVITKTEALADKLAWWANCTGVTGAAFDSYQTLRGFSLAASLGGVESLICKPATMTHAGMDEAAQAAAGITPSLLRISAGIEAEADLIGALKQEFANI